MSKVLHKPRINVMPMALPATVFRAAPETINSGIKTNWVKITPELATKWLEECNTNNRNVRDSYVARLAHDMASGKWRGKNGEAIRFDTNGRLVDGQHRLWACVQSKTPFESAVMRGIDPEDYKTIGIGAGKSFADFLGPVHGEKNVYLYSSSVRLVYFWTKGFLSTMRDGTRIPTIMDLEATYRDHPHLKDSVNEVASLRETTKLLTPSYAVLIHYAGFCAGIAATAKDFLERLGTGEGLVGTNPIYQLRKYLLANKIGAPGKKRPSKEYVLAMTIKAWNLRKAGKSIADLRVRAGEEFPGL